MSTPKRKPVTLATTMHITGPDGIRRLLTVSELLDDIEAKGLSVQRIREGLAAVPPVDPSELN